MQTFTVDMVKEKVTPGAVKYVEIVDGQPCKNPTEGKIGTQYIRKSALSGIPEKVKITVEY